MAFPLCYVVSLAICLWRFSWGFSVSNFMLFAQNLKIHKFKIKRKESKRIEKKARGVFKCVYRVRERPKEGGQLKDVKKHSKTYICTYITTYIILHSVSFIFAFC